MDPDCRTALELLDALEPVPTGPVRLSAEYLRAVAAIERLPQNQGDADKSWVGEALRRNREHFQRAIRR